VEATVRSIPTEVAVVDGQTFATGGKPALCFRGKTYALGIINDQESICTVTLSLLDYDKAPLIRYGAEAEYPVGRFIHHMERIMQTKSISEEAKQLILDWPNVPEDFGMPSIANHEPEKTSPPKSRLRTIKKANCIPTLAREYQTTPQKIRKFLRSQGMSAPYDNEKEIRKAMKKHNKE